MRHPILVATLGITLALLVARGAQAQNAISNPGFDSALGPWIAGSFGSESAVWQHVDADGSTGSGSVKIPVSAGVHGFTAVTECLTMSPGTGFPMTLTAKVRSNRTGSLGALAWIAWSGERCTGSALGSGTLYKPTVAGSWTPAGGTFTNPPNTESYTIQLQGASTETGLAQTIEIDDLYFSLTQAACAPADDVLCLSRSDSDHRFAVHAIYSSLRTGYGVGHAVSLETLGVAEGGVLWFFSATNPELLVKVIDGCTVTGYFWVYVAAGTDVGVDLSIGDTVSGEVYLFHSPDSTVFPNIQNVRALPCS